jgi:hypothetical protein
MLAENLSEIDFSVQQVKKYAIGSPICPILSFANCFLALRARG